MDTKNSIVSNSPSSTENVSTAPINLVPRRRSNALVIWLDNSININSEDYQKNITQLEHIVYTVNTFTDRNQCIDYLTDNDDGKVFLIISGILCVKIVPLIHDISHLHTIIIWDANEARYEQWAKQWEKIKGVYTDISAVCKVLKSVAQQSEQNDISISVIPATTDTLTIALDRLDPAFMYSQLLKEIFLTIDFEEKHLEEFVECCRKKFNDEQKRLEAVYKFVREYRDQTPIWWYTCDSFLYSMLNHALRTLNVDVIVGAGFFIADLHRHITLLHSEQFSEHHSNEVFKVYRGQGLSKADFELLTKTKGALISFNNFLSTSKNRGISLIFADCNRGDSELVGVVFTMIVDPSKSRTPFASVVDVAYLEEAEEEVLFSMNAVFRIRDIQPLHNHKHIFEVNLELTGDDDKDLRILTQCIRDETDPDRRGWRQLGCLLLKMGHWDKAQQIYDVLLNQTTTQSEQIDCDNQIGQTKSAQGASLEALTNFQKVLAMQKQSLPPNHPDLATSYNNIGNVYYNMGEYSKAFLSHEQALTIEQQSLPSNHPQLADS